jgi:hypothetical protein
MTGCLGCCHIESAPHKLRTGRTCCQSCPMKAEEEAAIARHVENLHRANGRDGRRYYLERVRVAEGDLVARDVESQYLIEWKAKQK